jgi:hypothetical protein
MEQACLLAFVQVRDAAARGTVSVAVLPIATASGDALCKAMNARDFTCE